MICGSITEHFQHGLADLSLGLPQRFYLVLCQDLYCFIQ